MTLLLVILTGWKLFFPLYQWDNAGAHAVPRPTSKGCAGCSVAQAEEIGAEWTYKWYPNTEDGVGPLVKPDEHSVSSVSQQGWLMWGNEMDLEGPQPETAAGLYPEAEALGVPLAVGGASQLDQGLFWLRDFHSAYHQQHQQGPTTHALHLHCYFTPDTVDACIHHVENVSALAIEWGIPEVWVSEFACYSMSDPACFSAAERFIQYLEENNSVTRYAWFGAWENPTWPWPLPLGAGALFDQETKLVTPIGEWYKEQ